MVSIPYFSSVFLVFVRILAVLMTAPIFSSRNIPTIAKIGFSVLLSVILLPSLGAEATARVSVELGPFVLSVAQEVLLGVLIGFMSNIVFLAVGMGANLMGMQAGFRAASLFNPLINVSSAALDQLYTFMAIGLFLTINGHHWLITALARTFKQVPLGTFSVRAVTVELLLYVTGEMFVAATRIALPVMGVLLLADVGLGLISKAVPQVQVFFLSLPIKIGLGLITLALTLSLTLPMIKEFLADMVGNISALAMP